MNSNFEEISRMAKAYIRFFLLGLFSWVGTHSIYGQESPYLDYSTLRPSPQWASYYNNGEFFDVSLHGSYELLVTPGWSQEPDLFVQRAKDLSLASEVKVTINQDLSQHGRYVALLRVKESWGGPRKFPENVGKDQGYALQVAPEGFVLVAHDRAGAFYGFQTILQAMALAKDARKKLPSVLLTDWPEIANRSILLVVNRMRGSDDLSYLKRVIGALAGLKYNNVFFEFDNALPGPRYAFPEQVSRPMDDQKIAELCDYARQLHMEVNLAFQFGGHCTWLLGEPAYRDLGEVSREKMSWNNSNWSPKNERLWDLIQDLVLHQISVCKPARVHIAHDEMDWGEFNTSPSSRSANLANDELLVYGINKLREIIPDHIRIQIWHDLFMPEEMKKSHAVGFVDSEKMFDLTPSDMDIHVWDYTGSSYHVDLISHVKNHGRHFWTATFQSEGIERVCYYARMFGAEGVMGTHWYEVDSKWTSPKGISSKAMHALVTLGNFSWNLSPAADLFELDASRLFRLLAEGVSSTRADEHGVVMDLGHQFNVGAGEQREEFSYLERLVRHFHAGKSHHSDGFAVGASGGILLAGRKDEVGELPEKVIIPVNRSVSEVLFYHTANVPDPDARLSAWNRAFSRPKIGSYTLVFEEGLGEVRQIIPLEYRWNIQDWNNLYGAYDARLAWSQVTNHGLRMQVQAYEWKSPDGQERLLKFIEFESDLAHGINPLLLDVLTYGADSDHVSQDDGYSELVIWEEGFEYESLEDLRSNWNGSTRVFEPAHWSLSSAASGQKSLMWTLKPGGQIVRQDIGFQVDRMDLSGADELRFSMRSIQGIEGEIKRATCAVYLGNAEEGYWYRLSFSLPLPGEGWKTYRIPLSSAPSEGPVPQVGGMANLNTLMISAWHNIDDSIVVLLDDMKIVKSSGPQLYQTVR